VRGDYALSVLSLFCGAMALAIALAWAMVGAWASQPVDLADVGSLMEFRRLYVAFEVGLPLAASVSAVSGLAAWRHAPARVGLVCTAAALTLFAFVLIAAGSAG
jgi:hypothetical protein